MKNVDKIICIFIKNTSGIIDEGVALNQCRATCDGVVLQGGINSKKKIKYSKE